MTVRRATLAEAPLFEQFTRNLFEEVTSTTQDPLLSASADSFIANWMSWFQLHVGRETGLVLLGENPKPVGFIAAYVSPPIFGSEVFPLVGVIGMWWVDAQHRRHGIGQQLLEQAEAWLREGGMRFVETHYMSSAHSAETLWKSAGYKPYFIAARKPLAG
jgi:ribosomal protein S18 acetylase RimI-like enzyme